MLMHYTLTAVRLRSEQLLPRRSRPLRVHRWLCHLTHRRRLPLRPREAVISALRNMLSALLSCLVRSLAAGPFVFFLAFLISLRSRIPVALLLYIPCCGKLTAKRSLVIGWGYYHLQKKKR